MASPNGAGDAFAAGYVYGHHEGWSVEDSVALAHATAAASLRAISTTGAVEFLEGVSRPRPALGLARRHRLRAAPRGRAGELVPAQFGRTTLSMTWMTPLLATMSALTTLASLTMTPSRGVDLEAVALDGLDLLGLAREVGGHDLAGDDVVGQDLRQLGLVLGLQQGVERAGRQAGEGGVGRREDGERARALERLDQAGGLDGLDQRAELAGRDGGVDDVAGGGLGRAGGDARREGGGGGDLVHGWRSCS